MNRTFPLEVARKPKTAKPEEEDWESFASRQINRFEGRKFSNVEPN